MRIQIITASAAVLILAACGDESPRVAPSAATSDTAPSSAAMAPAGATATAQLTDSNGASAGVARLSQGPQGVVIRIEATGLTPGWHGIHLHAVGTCEGPGFQSAGAHLHHGEADAVHGLLNADRDDDGDLPNIYAGADGRAFAEVYTPLARLADQGPGQFLLDADGSALLIHAQPDDHVSQPIGGSGDRVACGVIAAG